MDQNGLRSKERTVRQTADSSVSAKTQDLRTESELFLDFLGFHQVL